MFFSRKGKLKKQYDAKLVEAIKSTKDSLKNAKVLEELSDGYNLDVMVERKKAESIHFFLFKEARIRRVMIK